MIIRISSSQECLKEIQRSLIRNQGMMTIGTGNGETVSTLTHQSVSSSSSSSIIMGMTMRAHTFRHLTAGPMMRRRRFHRRRNDPSIGNDRCTVREKKSQSPISTAATTTTTSVLILQRPRSPQQHQEYNLPLS